VKKVFDMSLYITCLQTENTDNYITANIKAMLIYSRTWMCPKSHFIIKIFLLTELSALL